MRLGCGYPIGPLALIDAIGAKTVATGLDALYAETGEEVHRTAKVITSMASDDSTFALASDGDSVAPPDLHHDVKTVGVVGTGTMASGIVEVFAKSGYDVVYVGRGEEKVAGVLTSITKSLDKAISRGKLDEGGKSTVLNRLTGSTERDALADVDIVVEAIAEDLDIKLELFRDLDRICKPGAILATTTSSLSINDCADATSRPADVIGMHFFNPAPAMRLVEVIAGLDSGDAALALATATGEAMGKRVIAAADVPGFLVNRCSRPFGLEALRLLQERVADVETIDAVVRRGGGYRMGPFELQDLVGIDVGFAVAQSFAALSFGEPRWRPSPLSAQMVAAGRHGRKTGRGWYRYDDGPHRPPDPEAVEPAPVPDGHPVVVVAGWSVLAQELRDSAAAAGWDAREPADADGEVPWLLVDCGAEPEDGVLQGGPQLLLVEEGSLAALDPEGGAAGFFAFAPLDHVRLVELTRGPFTTALAAERSAAFFATLGMDTVWVGDAPGLVLGRIVAQLVNECAFAVGEGVGSVQDVDDGLVLGLNHPRGPLAWADEIGVYRILAVLDALCVEYREERYRAAPLLRRIATFHE